MHKAFYLIPVGLLAVFAAFEHRAEKVREKNEAVHAAQIVAEKAMEDARKAALAAQASADAKRRVAEREQQDRDRAARKLRDHTDAMQALAETTNAHHLEADRLAGELARLEQQLAEMHQAQNRTERETFELAKQVEQDRVSRRTAEIETLRAAKIATTRLTEAPWINSPIVAPASPKS